MSKVLKEKPIFTIRSRFTPIQSHGLECNSDEGMTQQHFKDECDINYLLRHYNDIPAPPPVYADCSQYNDLQSCIDKVNAAAEDFQNVPSDIRARFANNPVDFFNFCNNPANLEELRSLGLAEPGTVPLDVTVPGDTKSDNIVSERSDK